MFVDEVTLTVKAGKGGDGSPSLLRNGMTARGGPDGGNGGDGGSIYFRGSNNLRDLREFNFKKKITALDGKKGAKNKLHGKNADDLTVFLPLGTRITDLQTEKVYEIVDDAPLLFARGGQGGRGNIEFKTSTNQAPAYAEHGKGGQEKKIKLELRIIADIGLIGLPNAGKSSLLSVLTHATPKIGNYPFTTLEPNIGMMGSVPIADIPGLIEGAADGRGLGAAFLKHIEKTKILVHCIELTDGDAQEKYQTVRAEFESFNIELLEKPEIVLLTKIDLVDDKTVQKNKKLFEKKGKKVLTCSLLDDKSIKDLQKELADLI